MPVVNLSVVVVFVALFGCDGSDGAAEVSSGTEGEGASAVAQPSQLQDAPARYQLVIERPYTEGYQFAIRGETTETTEGLIRSGEETKTLVQTKQYTVDATAVVERIGPEGQLEKVQYTIRSMECDLTVEFDDTERDADPLMCLPTETIVTAELGKALMVREPGDEHTNYYSHQEVRLALNLFFQLHENETMTDERVGPPGVVAIGEQWQVDAKSILGGPNSLLRDAEFSGWARLDDVAMVNGNETALLTVHMEATDAPGLELFVSEATQQFPLDPSRHSTASTSRFEMNFNSDEWAEIEEGVFYNPSKQATEIMVVWTEQHKAKSEHHLSQMHSDAFRLYANESPKKPIIGAFGIELGATFDAGDPTWSAREMPNTDLLAYYVTPPEPIAMFDTYGVWVAPESKQVYMIIATQSYPHEDEALANERHRTLDESLQTNYGQNRSEWKHGAFKIMHSSSTKWKDSVSHTIYYYDVSVDPDQMIKSSIRSNPVDTQQSAELKDTPNRSEPEDIQATLPKHDGAAIEDIPNAAKPGDIEATLRNVDGAALEDIQKRLVDLERGRKVPVASQFVAGEFGMWLAQTFGTEHTAKWNPRLISDSELLCYLVTPPEPSRIFDHYAVFVNPQTRLVYMIMGVHFAETMAEANTRFEQFSRFADGKYGRGVRDENHIWINDERGLVNMQPVEVDGSILYMFYTIDYSVDASRRILRR